MKNIVLTGFMGTGKSTIGRALAAALGMTFVDMDEVLAARAGMSIADIFARQGEQTFRDAETALAQELGTREGLVIATGGGALLREENRAALGRNALLVCLTCSVEEILRRLDGDSARPLLAAPDKEARVRALLAARAPIYAGLPVQIDTTRRSVAEVVAEISRKYRGE